MLSFRRAVRVPALDAAREVHFLLHSGLRAYVVRARGVAIEKRLLVGTRLAPTAGARHLVQVVLAGRLRLGHGGREAWLGPGEVSLQAHGFPDERWEGARFEAVVVEWTAPWCSGRVDAWTTGRLGPRDLARIAGWAATVVDRELAPDRGAAHVAELLAVLASAGIPIARAEAPGLIEAVPPAARDLAAALSARLSNLEQRPMLIDLETALGRSARHLRRGLSAFDRYYGFPGGPSWHQLLHWWRLSMATTLMTATGATTERVGAALGYGSPRSFCLAMAHAGLPSPGRIAAAVERMR